MIATPTITSALTHPQIHVDLWQIPDFQILYTLPIVPVTRVVFHHGGTHRDESGWLWLACEFGQEYFPGIIDAEWTFREDYEEQFENKSWIAHRAQGTILVGTGGGPWDEHPFRGQARITGECTMSLVAKYLRLDTDPALAYIVEGILADDTQGKKKGPAVAQDLGLRFKYSRRLPRQILCDAMEEFHVHFARQREYLAAPTSVRQGCDEIIRTRTGDIRLIIAETDNKEMRSFIRAQCQQAHIVVLKRIGADDIGKAGNVQIFGVSPAQKDAHVGGQRTKVYDEHHPYNIGMDRVAALIRARELNSAPTDALGADGHIAGTRTWFYAKNANQLFNGSEHALAHPTHIPLTEIRDLVIRGYTM